MEGLPLDAMMNALEANVRTYVQHLLSRAPMPPLRRWDSARALTQLVDPDPQVLGAALEFLASRGAKGLVEEALQKSALALTRPDLTARVLLLPGDGQSQVLTSQLTTAYLLPTDRGIISR